MCASLGFSLWTDVCMHSALPRPRFNWSSVIVEGADVGLKSHAETGHVQRMQKEVYSR